MHTVMVLTGAFVLLAACVAVGRATGGSVNAGTGMAKGALVFLPLWFIGAGINMWIGVTQAGYSVADETPMFFVVFGIPAAVAVGLWWTLRRWKSRT